MLLNGRRLDHVQKILLAINDITERARAKEALEHSHAELERRVKERTARLQRLTRELSITRQRERKRLAALLHDDLQQYLVALKMQLNKARQESRADRSRRPARQVRGMISEVTRAATDLTQGAPPPHALRGGPDPRAALADQEMNERPRARSNSMTEIAVQKSMRTSG